MASTPPTIAATSTLAMVRTAQLRGAPVDDLLASVGFTMAQLEDPDARLPGPQVLTLWNALRQRTGDAALQLRAPTTLPIGAYRIIEYLLGASATVEQGVRYFAQFFGLIADRLALTVESGRDGFALVLATEEGNAVPSVYVDYVFAAFVGRVRLRMKPDLAVARLELRSPEPPNASVYADVFRAPVRFGAGADRLWFSADEWRRPMATADETLVALLEEHARVLRARIQPAHTGFVAQVEGAVSRTLSEGASAEAVARTLNVSTRTLQRKLVGEGTTFREVCERVKAEIAAGYLSDPRVSITEVACLLGFSEESAFTRAFRRWTGEAPGRWRRTRTPPRA